MTAGTPDTREAMERETTRKYFKARYKFYDRGKIAAPQWTATQSRI